MLHLSKLLDFYSAYLYHTSKKHVKLCKKPVGICISDTGRRTEKYDGR